MLVYHRLVIRKISASEKAPIAYLMLRFHGEISPPRRISRSTHYASSGAATRGPGIARRRFTNRPRFAPAIAASDDQLINNTFLKELSRRPSARYRRRFGWRPYVAKHRRDLATIRADEIIVIDHRRRIPLNDAAAPLCPAAASFGGRPSLK